MPLSAPLVRFTLPSGGVMRHRGLPTILPFNPTGFLNPRRLKRQKKQSLTDKLMVRGVRVPGGQPTTSRHLALLPPCRLLARQPGWWLPL